MNLTDNNKTGKRHFINHQGGNTMKRITAAILAALALSSSVAWAHSGGTNSQGCHYNHKTGQYHCH